MQEYKYYLNALSLMTITSLFYCIVIDRELKTYKEENHVRMKKTYRLLHHLYDKINAIEKKHNNLIEEIHSKNISDIVEIDHINSENTEENNIDINEEINDIENELLHEDDENYGEIPKYRKHNQSGLTNKLRKIITYYTNY